MNRVALGNHALTTVTHVIAGREFLVAVPSDPDIVMSEAMTFGSEPYWGTLWGAASTMAKCVLEHEWPSHLRAAELGCGVGLVGIAALAVDMEVTFSDVVDNAVELAIDNARQNGFHASGYVFDWFTKVGVGLPSTSTIEFPLLLASDVLYEPINHEPLLRTAERMLSSGGEFWIGDPGRVAVSPFLALATERGWQCEIRNEHTETLEKPHDAFQLLVLSREENASAA